MNFYNALNNEQKVLEERIARKEAFINAAPEGKLRCYPVGDSWRWYSIEVNPSNKPIENAEETDPADKDNPRQNKFRKYIPKDNEELAKSLALKGLYEYELIDDKQELRAINLYLKNYSSFERGNRYIERASEYARLLSEHYDTQQRSKSSYVSSWLDNRYTGPVPHPEELLVPTRAGFRVRSKSERDIIRFLMDYDIPFKYEQKLVCEGKDLYPDFTILSPVTGREIIWEHNGLMDRHNYAAKKLDDERLYHKLGFHRGKNMIVSYEENNEGIDEQAVEFYIHHIILKDDI